MTELLPVPGIPALRMDECLVITDLHIGVEAHLRSKGFNLVSRTEEMLKTIIEAAGTQCSRLIIIGDVKDSVPGMTRQEYREIPRFFDTLLEHFDAIDVVRGNHDTGIEEFLPGRVNICPATGITYMNVGLCHGHTWPSAKVMSSDVLVMGHDHPAVMFKDGVGKRTNEPCWVKGRFKEGAADKRCPMLPASFIIVPAFNRILGGSPVNVIGEPLLGPIMGGDLLDLNNADLFLLDGICLGKRTDLMVTGREPPRRAPRMGLED